MKVRASGTITGAMLLVIVCVGSASTFSFAAGPPPTPSASVPSASVSVAASTPPVTAQPAALLDEEVRLRIAERDIQEQQGRIEALSGLVADLKRTLYTVSILIAVSLALGRIFGWGALRRWFGNAVEQRLQGELEKKIGDLLPARLEHLEQRVQSELLRVAQVLALHAQERHEEVLMAFGWDGKTASLRSALPGVRRAIIEALHNARKDRDANRALAWAAVGELLADDPSAESVRLFLRLAIAQRKHREGYEQYERLATTGFNDSRCGLMASTLLRKLGRNQDALALAMKFRDDADLNSSVAIAVLQRDLGDFGAANDVLRPAVESMLSEHVVPKDGHRVLNTFVANCIDRHQAEQAVPVAQLMLRRPGAVEVFTVTRLCTVIPASDQRKALLSSVRTELANLHQEDEGVIRATALLHTIDGEHDRAIALLKTRIDAQANVPRKKHDLYYLRASLARILCDRNRAGEAIDVLMPAISETLGGEAKYVMAVARGQLGDASEAARWLREAIRELPRWASIARDDPTFASLTEVKTLLAETARGPSSGRPSPLTPPIKVAS